MENVHIDLYFIIFYFCPYLLLIPSWLVNKVFRKYKIKIRGVDFIVPVLIFSIHIFSVLIVGISFIPYFTFVISIIGLILATLFAFKYKKLTILKVLRVWWRYVFICALLLYISLGILLLV
ncbi:hypothetical protein MPS01_02230 [Marinilactibacillus psychrotolerans]|uniref:DUF3397 domain-containing protein n=1 Tax=Marinilactibacillus psychrotolerans TaxID=191770 RepID=A0AAV3WRT0_9LACT|nr:hypothetical protein MPS01_02230 [Marinilactibacillus psychrotolerans]GEQ34577.1 hypothetical protein M132T_00850 [Marinilactibacillus psychrotolerans]SDB99179.1 Protein of unknown function [Marinilactibacillus psychrotolerans]